jgi:PPM family protein phosphatase
MFLDAATGAPRGSLDGGALTRLHGDGGGGRRQLMATPIARKLLAETGYLISFRGAAWTECFVSNGSERWHGRGPGEEEALGDVLRQMLPSALARRLLFSMGGPESPPKPPEISLSESAIQQAAEAAVAPIQEEAEAAVAPSEEVTEAAVAPVQEATEQAEPPIEEATEQAEPPIEEATEQAEPPTAEAAAPAEEAIAAATEDVALPIEAVAEAPAPSAEEAVAFESAPGAARSGRVLAAAGTGRGASEGACLAFPERGVVAVADGLSAPASGDAAAALTIEAVRAALSGDATLSPIRRKGLPLLLAAIERVNGEIFSAGRRETSRRGPGTTVAVALAVGKQVALAHVGDSRIYRLRRGVLELLTTDHSGANRRLRAGEARSAERRSGIRAVGTHKTVEVDSSVVTVQPGDVLLLSTDGLHSAVKHDDLAEVLVHSPDPEAAVAALMARASANGGPGGASAAVLRWD